MCKLFAMETTHFIEKIKPCFQLICEDKTTKIDGYLKEGTYICCELQCVGTLVPYILLRL